MAGFQFKLQPVLKVRQAAEDRCQRELADIMRRRNAAHDRLREMQQTIVESKHALATGLVGAVNVSHIGQFARYSAQVRVRAQTLLRELAGIEREVNAARARLLEATRARKALELLRDKQQARWELERRRREAVEMDELGTQSFIRQQSAGADS
jgi:flagellar FliJ protein